MVRLELIRRIDSCLTFGFQGIDRVLDATLTDELCIHVTWDDDWWDMLTCLESYSKRVPGGYVCADCDPATRATFPTREALWVDELFEPLLLWINETLAPAKALYLYRYGGMTAAKLISGTV
jgi:hypothetical protein